MAPPHPIELQPDSSGSVHVIHYARPFGWGFLPVPISRNLPAA
jgi:hypothetical protein